MTPEEPLPGEDFLAELAVFFQDRAPEGTPQWAFQEALIRIEEGGAPGAGAPPPVGPAGVRQRAVRVARKVLQAAGPQAGHRQALLDALRALGTRLDVLEEAERRAAQPFHGVAWLTPPLDVTRWAPRLIESLSYKDISREVPRGSAAPAGNTTSGGSDAPACHADCGDGALLALLAKARLDVLGVDVRGGLAWDAARAGLDVRLGEAGVLFADPTFPVLRAVVLSGVPDRLTLAGKVALIEAATARLAPGGLFVVIDAVPEAWCDAAPPAARDLLPGPLHAEAWREVLVHAGIGDIEMWEGTGPQGNGAGDEALPTCAIAGRRA